MYFMVQDYDLIIQEYVLNGTRLCTSWYKTMILWYKTMILWFKYLINETNYIKYDIK